MEKEAVCTEKRLAELIDTYDKLVFSICYKLTGDYFTAEDLTQETSLLTRNMSPLTEIMRKHGSAGLPPIKASIT